MNTRLKNKRLRIGRLLFLLLLTPVAPMAFTACDTEPAEIVITMKSDLSKIIEAINDANKSLTEKLSLIESAAGSGFADDAEARKLLQQAIESLTGTESEKLAAIETAVKSQTASLETKLTLIETAVANGFADQESRQALIKTALESNTGTVTERVKAIETAIKDQNTTLDTKLTAVETAVKEGFAADTAAFRLIRQAVEAIPGTVNEKMVAIEEAISNPNTGLTVKIQAIETAVKNGFTTESEKHQLIQDAIGSLKGSTEEKLGTIQEAITSQTISLEGKLDLIQGALNTGLDDANTALGEIKDAINSLKTSVDGDTGLIKKIDDVVSKLGTIDTTLNDDVSDALTDILGAIAGLTDYSDILSAIQEAIGYLNPETPEEINGHACVDMGMRIKGKPIYWATMNVGATKPEDYGDYFAWGETTVKDAYNWSSYFDNPNGDGTTFDKYALNKKTVLDPEDDAATKKWGGKWRIPTPEEWEWLLDYCSWTWTTGYNGTEVKGIIVTSNVVGFETSSIFLPATGYRNNSDFESVGYCGYFWSSSLLDTDETIARHVYARTNFGLNDGDRYLGETIRPVAE